MKTSLHISLARPRARFDKRSRRAGFSLVELMIALVAGTVTITAAYYLGSTSSRTFNNQMRVTETQSSLRAAMEQVQRDILRAGFLSTPYIDLPEVPDCLGIAGTKSTLAVPQAQLRGVRVVANDSTSLSPTLSTVLTGPERVDSLFLFGNYDDGDMYKLTSDSSSSVLNFETTRESFRRSFIGTDGNFDQNRFNSVFANRRIVRIDSNGNVFFRAITGLNAGAQVTLDNEIPEACFSRSTALITPLKIVRYNLEVLTGAQFARLASSNSARSGSANKAALVRREFDNQGEIAGSARVVLDYAVEFQVDRIVAGNTPGTWNTLPAAEPDGLTLATLPRALRITLSARAEDVDIKAPAPTARNANAMLRDPLLGAQVKVGTHTAYARVRTLRQEFFLPNMRL